MRRELIAICLCFMVSLQACSAIQAVTTPASSSELLLESRAVITADETFIVAATALNTAEANGTINRAQGEPLRTQAYLALIALRAAVDARRHPDFSAFNNAINAINGLTGGPH